MSREREANETKITMIRSPTVHAYVVCRPGVDFVPSSDMCN